MKNIFVFIAIIVLTMINLKLNAQNVGIGNSNFTPDNSAGLEVRYTDKGLLIPRVALTSATDQTTIPSPAISLLVYNTGTGGLTPAGYYYWDGSQWTKLATGSGGGNAWLLLGNAGTTEGTNFLGTTDSKYLSIRTNNTEKVRITTKGQIETYNTGKSVFIGEGAGANATTTTDYYNTFIGYNAGYSNTTGSDNFAVGYQANYANQTGFNNVAIGHNALKSNTSSNNFAVGNSAMQLNTSGQGNIAFGVMALYNNNGDFNIAMGNNSMLTNTSGSYNIALGLYTLHSNTTGNNNIALGYYSLKSNNFGNNNIAIGYEAGQAGTAITSGSNNTFIGYQAQSNSATRTNATAIGNGVVATADNAVFLGNSSVTGFYVGTGSLSTTTQAPNLFYDNSSGQIFRSTSSGSGNLPSGTLGQTLRHDGSNWIANSFLYNNGTNVGINTTPATNAVLDVASTNKGVNVPRMTYAQRNSISTPTEGLLIYNTDSHCFEYYYNGSWQSLCGNPSGNKKVYRYVNGSPQRYTNTSGSYQYITVKCWGAGGGGNGNSNSDMGFGGGGGYVQAQVNLAPGEYLDIEPAEHGEVGGGGGASVVVHSSNGLILVAAGGGGAGANGGSEGPPPANGGAGGGLTGSNGDSQSYSGYYANGGGGGTQIAGGAGGTASGPNACDGLVGSSLKGGASKSGSSCGSTYSGGDRDEGGSGCSNGCGGSGGSGYYGGGGAGSVYTHRGGGGGGGSSYYKPWPATNYAFTVAGSGQVAGNINDVDYQFNAGMGGNPRQPGNDGLVVLIIQ